MHTYYTHTYVTLTAKCSDSHTQFLMPAFSQVKSAPVSYGIVRSNFAITGVGSDLKNFCLACSMVNL